MPRAKGTIARRKKEDKLPKTFSPRFWDMVDGRLVIFRKMKEKYERLLEDSGADNMQKESLCQLGAFILTRLESLQVDLVETGAFNFGEFASLSNTYMGILNRLGIESPEKETIDLKEYLSKKDKKA